ncbi:hypothetical protein [Spirosoma agri]|uniref:Uncharacterized protein n=1 Tax=Spirosoma agri TaxID=1987381 RepID=A0A6M0IS65_9BACT|nr:hypothetical protein [Spirosoma agri]NEU69853.1 hypothetical protein [Spirosoma agri]
MSQLLIEIDTPEDEALLMQLLPKLNARLIDKRNEESRNQTFADIARQIASRGGVVDSFGDPLEWQREVRSWDRVLDGREE